jgi:hypothetical protein
MDLGHGRGSRGVAYNDWSRRCQRDGGGEKGHRAEHGKTELKKQKPCAFSSVVRRQAVVEAHEADLMWLILSSRRSTNEDFLVEVPAPGFVLNQMSMSRDATFMFA